MILITGATGFIGKNLINALPRKNNVKILARDPIKAKNLFPDLEIVKGDIATGKGIKEALEDVSIVIHLAGMVSYSKPREELFRINVTGTRNLLRYCDNVKRFIFSSSVSVYGPIETKANENHRTNPVNPYGESKLEAEKLVKDSGISHVILRIAPVYGVGSPSWIKNLKLLESGFPIPRTKNLTHIVHISDVVNALKLSMKKGSGIYNIADKKPVEFTKFAEMIVKLLGKRPIKVPFWIVKLLAKAKGMDTYLEVLTMNRNYDITKARRELGYEPKAVLEKEIRNMVKWYKMSNLKFL
ncbi:MAG: hypothetical protein DRP15_02395 [Candidatus Aenigmatarchaeota archaeon]|nr:MAG: hypothetical protein DRP15_02395 [Candidatus Aenigmarchaeota archaeon]